MSCSNRTELAKYFKELGYKTGAEIGVDEGDYSEVLCREIPGVKLYCIDCWDIKTGVCMNHRRRKYERVQERLASYDATLIKKFSLDAVKDFTDGSLDFVYIDAGHSFDDVMRDLIEWTKKVRKGGIVSGHDYVVHSDDTTHKGIVTAVSTYIKCHVLNLETTTNPKESVSWYFHKKWNI
jgi:hypothetical protein